VPRGTSKTTLFETEAKTSQFEAEAKTSQFEAEAKTSQFEAEAVKVVPRGTTTLPPA